MRRDGLFTIPRFYLIQKLMIHITIASFKYFKIVFTKLRKKYLSLKANTKLQHKQVFYIQLITSSWSFFNRSLIGPLMLSFVTTSPFWQTSNMSSLTSSHATDLVSSMYSLYSCENNFLGISLGQHVFPGPLFLKMSKMVERSCDLVSESGGEEGILIQCNSSN